MGDRWMRMRAGLCSGCGLAICNCRRFPKNIRKWIAQPFKGARGKKRWEPNFKTMFRDMVLRITKEMGS